MEKGGKEVRGAVEAPGGDGAKETAIGDDVYFGPRELSGLHETDLE